MTCLFMCHLMLPIIVLWAIFYIADDRDNYLHKMNIYRLYMKGKHIKEQ